MLAFISAIIAIFSTLVGSFSGGGASMMMFPLLLMFVESSYLPALVLSKIAATAMTMSAARIHVGRHLVNWRFFLVLLVAGFLGMGLGTYLVQYQLNEVLFKGILGMLLLGTSGYLLFSRSGLGLHAGHERGFGFWVMVLGALAAFVINVLNGMFGGTGVFLTLYLVLFMRMTFIHSMIYVMPTFALISFIQTIYLMGTVSFDWKIGIVMGIAGLSGGFLGTRLQYLKGNMWVKRASVLVMLLIGGKVLIGLI
ncbi:sulfite exporter TauE/SafE family protein [Patescibacteria group bacterium]|nr:sulfite exporter TauE/SafE family protein [Patescibacteria group bacterium]